MEMGWIVRCILAAFCGYGISTSLLSAGADLDTWEFWVGVACFFGIYIVGVSHCLT